MPPRRAGAPRLIDWTGERCVPWAPDIQVVYEHYHRYLWAAPLVSGLRVLDLGSGEGFGSALLADRADSVVGVDIDSPTVDHATLNYSGPGLDFRIASATDLREFPADSFDAVVAFEIIEHIADHEGVMSEVTRVLDSDGLLILSTPDRRAYSEATGQENPFHQKELTTDELRQLLALRFAQVELLNQRVSTGSRIESLERRGGAHLDVRIERAGDDWRTSGPPSPFYLIAVASNGSLPALPTESTLSDFGIELVRSVEREAGREAARGADEVNRVRAEAEAQVAGAEARAAEAERSSGVFDRNGASWPERERLESQVLERTRELTKHQQEVVAMQQEATRRHAETARIEESITWRLFQAARARLYGALGGHASWGGRVVGRMLRLLGGLAFRQRPAPGPTARMWRPIVLPEMADPIVSIIIPVHDAAELTERCLRAVACTADVPYEVIVVDDDADPETKALLRVVEGALVLVNEKNLNYLLSVNRGAAAARGRHVVLLNNDTEPQPGWLDALVQRADSASDIGVVAAKLVYPGGQLQEAGGIVWRDGTAWNYGHGHDSAAPEFNYVREIDYGSAAALLVRRQLWQELDGFDQRFVPAYWEDTDLCFAARSKGWRVLYEPAATVIHVEGGSMGTDTEGGGKRHQKINQPRFEEKWRDVLREQPAGPSPERAYAAANHRAGAVALVVDHRVPTPDRDAGSLRMCHLLQGLKDLGCHVVFLADDLALNEPYTSRLRGTGVEVLVGNVSVHQRLQQLGGSIELAILSRPYVAPRYLHLIRKWAPRAHLAYDTVDLHYVREGRRARTLGKATSGLASSFRELELGIARASDTTLVVTEVEREELLRLEPDLEVRVLPVAHTLRKDDAPGRSQRKGLLFVGGFEHDPNVDAVLFLVKEIMPLIWRELGDVPLSIVGAQAPEEIRALAGPNVDVAGWVEEIEPLIDSAMVSVAPLRYGAGMKGKVTQSLAAGLPVVTSTVGAEGLGAENGRHLFVADDPELFARRVIDLHRDPEVWNTLSREGQVLASQLTSPAQQVEVLADLLRSPRETVPSNGAPQVVGSRHGRS